MTAEPVETEERIDFITAPPGLHPHTAFRLDAIPGATGLSALRSMPEGVRLFVLDPAVIGHSYAPRTLATALAVLGADAEDEVRILLVANPSEEGVHVNLRAPILVHRRSGRATQTILEDQDLPVRLLLVP